MSSECGGQHSGEEGQCNRREVSAVSSGQIIRLHTGGREPRDRNSVSASARAVRVGEGADVEWTRVDTPACKECLASIREPAASVKHMLKIIDCTPTAGAPQENDMVIKVMSCLLE